MRCHELLRVADFVRPLLFWVAVFRKSKGSILRSHLKMVYISLLKGPLTADIGVALVV